MRQTPNYQRQPAGSTSPTVQRMRATPSIHSSTPEPQGVSMAAARYHSNLKVLRRRDPTIQSIFHQFSHVCVYHYNGSKWEKQGFEGSMFLYERNVYPPYGFYILNRMGTEDYIQRMYPEDEMSLVGGYFMIRSFPAFSKQRVSLIEPCNDPFSDIYKVDAQLLAKEEKGRPIVIGLWMFAVEPRQVMTEVMKRLHDCTKANVPYPMELRYGPDRPAPSSLAASIDQPTTTGQSDLNQLLAKLGPSPSPAANNGTLESLFSGMTPSPTVQQPGGASHTTQGIALLNSIFASATVNAESSHLPAADSHLLESQPRPPPDSVKIYSPIPNNAALPQILNQDVISTLLGLPPSRAPSVADSYSGASPVQEEIYRPGDDAPVDAISRLFSQAQSAQEPPKPRLQQVNGDATPRAPMTTLSSQPEDIHVNGHRKLVPFQPDSELWPYPQDHGDLREEGGEGDIVELDFGDTSALSDPAAFQRASERNSHRDRQGQVGNGKPTPSNARARAKEKRKLEREAIENGWDFPSPANPKQVENTGEVKESIVRASIISQLPSSSTPILRNDFVRQVLTLIHTDKTFVDNLWQDYVARSTSCQ